MLILLLPVLIIKCCRSIELWITDIDFEELEVPHEEKTIPACSARCAGQLKDKRVEIKIVFLIATRIAFLYKVFCESKFKKYVKFFYF